MSRGPDRVELCAAGVRRCFKNRHAGRYSFMSYRDAVRHCRKWIAALREAQKGGVA